MSKINRMKHVRTNKPDRAEREEFNRNKMLGRSLRALAKRGGLTVTEFRRYRRAKGLGYMEAVRELNIVPLYY